MDVVNRSTCELCRSVHTPNFPIAEWLHNPDLSAVAALPRKYWKVVGETVQPMDAPEQTAVDGAEESQATAVDRLAAKASLQERVMLALMEILVEEINLLRTEHSLPPRTMVQLKTAIEAKIDEV